MQLAVFCIVAEVTSRAIAVNPVKTKRAKPIRCSHNVSKQHLLRLTNARRSMLNGSFWPTVCVQPAVQPTLLHTDRCQAFERIPLKSRNPRHSPPQYQRMHIMRAFVGVDHLQVHQVARHAVLV